MYTWYSRPGCYVCGAGAVYACALKFGAKMTSLASLRKLYAQLRTKPIFRFENYCLDM